LRRVVAVGSSLISTWPDVIRDADPGCPCDFLKADNAGELPSDPPQLPDEYDFQIVQMDLRSIIPEAAYFRLSYHDEDSYRRLFAQSKRRLSFALKSIMRWNVEHGMLTFVCNFMVPQQDLMGRLLPRHDLRNMTHFVQRLNEALALELACYSNAHLLDFDQIVSTFGRRYFQDDAVSHTGRNAALAGPEFDGRRPIKDVNADYPVRIQSYVQSAWAEVVAMYRTIRQIDAVRLVVMDDSLWRLGVAKGSKSSPQRMEGWPLGVIEALGALKRRGVLLALVSKDDEPRVSAIWNRTINARRFSLEDFAIRKINRRAKAENLGEILQETNLSPQHVVFVGGDAAERESIKAAFPEVRTLGPDPYVWRRILLWSAETQVAADAAEPIARIETTQAPIQPEATAENAAHEAYLTSLGLEMSLFEISGTEHSNFPRSLELINETDQFNTTGRRWTEQECAAAFDAGMRFYAFDVKDKNTSYGLAGVLIVDQSNIAQFVMSSGVLGMDVELAALAEVNRIVAARGIPILSANLLHTEANLLCRDLYRRCKFQGADGSERWLRPSLPALNAPKHIALVPRP
jgi:FkbH-like protein